MEGHRVKLMKDHRGGIGRNDGRNIEIELDVSSWELDVS